MDDKTNQCYLCKYLDRFYTKGTKQFNKTNCGWCCMNVKVVQIHDGCDKYERRHKQQRSMRMLKYTLNDLLTEFSEVRKVLEAEKDEFNE